MFRREAIEAKRQKLHGDVFLIQPTSFLVLGFLILLIVSFAVTLLFAGSYARSEGVIGHLVPSNGLVKIQTAQPGTLESIHVRERDLVKAGQKLAAISVSTNALDGTSFVDKAIAALIKQEVELTTQITLETNQLEAETARLIAEQKALDLREDSLQVQLGFQQQLGASIENNYRGVQKLLLQGYISKEESKRRQQEWIKQKTQEKLREQELNEVKLKQKQLEIRLLQLPNESKQRVARLMVQQAELEGKKTELSGRRAYAINSSINGKVLSISMDSIGRSVDAGQALFTIMPEGSVLEAELFVPSRAVGFVAKGQEVRLLYDAFPYQYFGSHKAIITNITETILSQGELLTPFKLTEPVYRVTADIEKKTIESRDMVLSLQSGMTLKANIVLERRSFIEWLLDPLRAVRERA
ncbi:MAG: HlyD family efflux transporter periplasmic adaptor subunit [Gammaproteobacteria bacterium]|jgi:membrane fusion protein|nr:HlyD family efflux transporter periplasmic adaptor subunit [Gammaproteobacteria bacterium]